MAKLESEKLEITGEIMISDLIDEYPQAVDYLIAEYGFHCVSCFISSYEKLEDGARVHGIVDEDFSEMIENLNKLVSGELEGYY